jgi:hypothetical protein
MKSKLKKIKNFLADSFPVILYLALIGIIVILGYYAISFFKPTYFGQYQKRTVSGYINSEWRFVYQLLLMVILLIVVVIIVGVLSLLNALTGRWTSIQVLIVYEHKHKDLVALLGKDLSTQKIMPFFIPFVPMEHDVLIENVRRAIKKCTAVIVLPGSQKSFVDAEILAASALEKPIIHLKVTDDQKTPDTSFKGYPVFDLERLKQFQLTPLQQFLLYITRSPKELLKNFCRATISFYEKKGIYVVIGIFACDTFSTMLMPVASLFAGLQWEELVRYIIFWSLTIVTIGIFGFLYIQAIIARIRAMRITRQQVITGNMTHQLLEKGLDTLQSDQEIVYCIVPHGLPPRR